jgi:hypothetical protein
MSAIPPKALIFRQLIFRRWIAERPFRLAKLTACRKKCAFLSVPGHEVKAPKAKIGKNDCAVLPLGSIDGDYCRRLQARGPLFITDPFSLARF